MSILTWIIVGLIAGWLAGAVVKGGGYGIIIDIIVGIVGALVGGFLTGVLLHRDYISGLNLTTVFVAFVGAVILISVARAVTGGRTRL
jgi:uncharacterized membrane protein YeaQ/YmgE (transglycosylase-associated protein family)